MSSDPYTNSGRLTDPVSWNRYAYGGGDPVNRVDPNGSDWTDVVNWFVDGIYAGATGSGSGGSGYGVNIAGIVADAIAAALAFVRQTPAIDDFVSGKPVGYNGAKTGLGRKDCYTLFGFASADAAQSALAGVKFVIGSYGPLQVQDVPGGQQIAPGTPPPADNDGNNTVRINYDYNWLFFDKNPATNITTGRWQLFDYLSDYNKSNGTDLTSYQLAETIILHELGHLRYPNMNPMVDSPEFARRPVY